MVSRNSIQNIIERPGLSLTNLVTEEATKHALVLPFIQALGYDVFNPGEVIPEFNADYGLKSGEKVDYAITHSGAPIILIECKKVGDALDVNRASQLSRYFTNTPARIGVLTDGLIYKFFSDLDNDNTMDKTPFLEINITRMGERDYAALFYFTKQHFDLEEVKTAASELKYISGMKVYLSNIYNGSPDDDFTRLLARQVFSGSLIQNRMEYFSKISRSAFRGFVSDLINDALQRATDIVNTNPIVSEETLQADDPEASASQSNIVTTEEEIQGYEIVKSLVADVVDVDRIVMVDRASYCTVCLDGSRFKVICRFRFNSVRWTIGIVPPIQPESGNKDEVIYNIQTVNDILQYKEELQASVKGYL